MSEGTPSAGWLQTLPVRGGPPQSPSRNDALEDPPHGGIYGPGYRQPPTVAAALSGNPVDFPTSGLLDIPVPILPFKFDEPIGEIVIARDPVPNANILEKLINVSLHSISILLLTIHKDHQDQDEDYAVDRLPCIVICPRGTISSWADGFWNGKVAVVEEVIKPLADGSDITDFKRSRHQCCAYQPTDRFITVTDPDTFAQTFASHPATAMARIHCITAVELDTYVNKPVWNRMNLVGQQCRKYLLCCSAPPNPTTTLLPLMAVLQNRELASKVHAVDELRGYDPKKDPYLLPHDHNAVGYKYCEEVFAKWVLNNNAINQQEWDRRVKDVMAVLIYPYIF